MKNITLKSINNCKNSIIPFGVLYSIFLVLSYSIIVSLLDNIIYRILCFFIINQDLILNSLVILFNFINSIISICLLLYLSSDIKFKNYNNIELYLKDYTYLFFIIISFRIFYDNTFFPLTAKFFLNNEMTINKYTMLLLLTSILIAPIVEELLYRGLILNGLSKKYSPLKSIIISSIIFASMHSNIVQGINAFLISLLISYIFIFTHSLKLSIFIHSINNIIVTLFSDFLIFSNINILFFILPISLFILFYCFMNLNIKNREKLCIKNHNNINFPL